MIPDMQKIGGGSSSNSAAPTPNFARERTRDDVIIQGAESASEDDDVVMESDEISEGEGKL